MELSYIIEADKAARLAVEEAKAKAARLDEETPHLTKAAKTEILEAADKEIAAFQAQQTQMANRRMEQARRAALVCQEQLDAQYKQRAEEWLDHIVSAATQV